MHCTAWTCLNPLPTDDTLWHRQILAAGYQLAQFVLKIGSALAERVGQGEVGGSTALPDRTDHSAVFCHMSAVITTSIGYQIV